MSVTRASSVVSGLFIVAAVSGMFITSITRRAQAESDQGVWMIISHKVVDYKFWKPAHEQSAAIRGNFGPHRSIATCFGVSVRASNRRVMNAEKPGGIDTTPMPAPDAML